MTEFKKCLIAMMLVVFSSGLIQAEPPKMATVNMQKLFKEYHRTVTAQKHFNAEYAKIQKTINDKNEAINKLRRKLHDILAELKKEDLSAEERANKQRDGQLISQELKMMQQDVQTYSQEEKTKVAQKKAASMQGIMTDIKQKVIVLSEKMGHDYVFDRSGLSTNQVSFFLYLKDANDITATLLKELNKFAPGADSQ
ncbi:hypothetical protein NT6N_38570 [Oceaniferula spumae]|uniref:OmpH family outer membrane protein n=1 Tax=Oceaniferula spumae TaxID=2979115 RepID=A0AAT9FS33_9BACT